MEKTKTLIKYIIIAIVAVALAFLYSYICKGYFDVENIIMFVALVAYLVFFMKFLIRLFK